MTDSTETDNRFFSDEVLRLRAEYEKRRLATNLYPPVGRPIFEVEHRRHGGRDSMTYWFEKDDDEQDWGQCIRVYDVPGTLSGDVLRLHQNGSRQVVCMRPEPEERASVADLRAIVRAIETGGGLLASNSL